MRTNNPYDSSGFTGIIRDAGGGIDVRYYERRAARERADAIDSIAKWFGQRFTRRNRPMREG